MNSPLDLWPWLVAIAVMIGLALFAFSTLGPVISGLLLLVVPIVIFQHTQAKNAEAGR